MLGFAPRTDRAPYARTLGTVPGRSIDHAGTRPGRIRRTVRGLVAFARWAGPASATIARAVWPYRWEIGVAVAMFAAQWGAALAARGRPICSATWR